MENSNSPENRNYKNLFKKNKRLIQIISAILVVIVVSILAYTLSVNKSVKSYEGKVYPGVSVYGIELGGLTKEEAINALNEKLTTNIMDKLLVVTVGDKKVNLNYSDLGIAYDVAAISEEAINYGKDKTKLTKYNMIKNGEEYNIEAKISYDEGKLKEFEEKVKSTVNIEPQDAQLKMSGGSKTITPEVVGYKINEEELHNKLVENINGDPNEEVDLVFELEESKAKVTTEDLEKITGIMSSYSSNYRNSGDGRVKNMQIAIETVNGTLLMPGEEFSYNELIGDTTPDKGYEKANTYVGNEIVPDYGGGICQVSTTLYRAVMRSNLRSTERRNHSLTVSYSEPGLDATVAYGFIDYKFKNTYDFPVYIEGYIGGGTVGFNIYGNPESLGGRTYELVNEIHETYKPEVEYIDDPTLEVGKEVVQSNGMPGYKASSYQVTYENGKEIDREFIATDVYLTTNTVIKRGTKKVN